MRSGCYARVATRLVCDCCHKMTGFSRFRACCARQMSTCDGGERETSALYHDIIECRGPATPVGAARRPLGVWPRVQRLGRLKKFKTDARRPSRLNSDVWSRARTRETTIRNARHRVVPKRIACRTYRQRSTRFSVCEHAPPPRQHKRQLRRSAARPARGRSAPNL